MLLYEVQRKATTSFAKMGPNLIWKSFEEEDDLTLPFMLQDALKYCTKLSPHDKVLVIISTQMLTF